MTQITKRALLIVDLQKAYFNNEALQEKQRRLVEKTNELISLARQHEWPIFSIITEHQKTQATWTLNMRDDGEGYLFAQDTDSNLVNGLDLKDALMVRKTRDSAFYDTNLLAMLHNLNITELIICGVSSHTCILQTAADAYAANLRVTLAVDAIASHKPKFHEVALKILETEYRQRLQTNTELEDNIKNNRQ